MSSKPQLDHERIAEAMLQIVTAAVTPLLARLKALETQAPRDGQPGVPGAPGRDGRDGKDGTSVTLADLQPLVADLVAKAVSELPPPQHGRDGLDGKNGRDGLDGKDGRDGIDGKDGAPGADGKDGRDGINGHDGREGSPGERGEPGARGEQGDPGLNGTDGRDGLNLDFFEATVTRTFDPATRTLIDRVEHNGRVKEIACQIPGFPLYRGVYDPTVAYQAGDQCTYAGSTWTAKCATMLRPDDHGDGARDWVLSSKRGREGRKGADGKHGKDGRDGKDGRSLTPFDPRG